MANYFHIDANGTKRGPINEEQIKQLVRHNQIASTTLLETEDGTKIPAGEISTPFDSQATMESRPRNFDIGFAHFFTPILITIIWWLTVLVAILSFVTLLGQAEGNPLIILIGMGITICGLLWCRIILEFFVIQFRMERHQRTIKEILERNEKTSKS